MMSMSNTLLLSTVALTVGSCFSYSAFASVQGFSNIRKSGIPAHTPITPQYHTREIPNARGINSVILKVRPEEEAVAERRMETAEIHLVEIVGKTLMIIFPNMIPYPNNVVMPVIR